MTPARIASTVAWCVGALAVFWTMLDSGYVRSERAPRSLSAAFFALGTFFGLGGFAMLKGGQPDRAPRLVGLSSALLLYAIARLLLM